MNSWERFDETSLPDKKAFYSSLNIKGITDVDYTCAKKVFKIFNNKHLGDFHDLYVQSDALLLADVFETSRNTCIEIYELDPAHFLSAPGLAWQACFKKSGIELELLTDVDMLLMVEKGIRSEICQVIYRYVKINTKYLKQNYDKNKKSSYFMYWDANSLYVWAMSQKSPVRGFKWIKNISKFNEEFIKKL